MTFTVKRFNELTNDELFDMYHLRNEVFVVEQECIYQDIDSHDKVAAHVFMFDEGRLMGYLRVLPKNTVFEDVSIGRVISVERRKGNGSLLVKEGIRVAAEVFNADKITIEAQTYARSLYEKLGFVQVSDEFPEDGIPHIKMQLEIKNASL